MGPHPACIIGLIPVRLRHNMACLNGSGSTNIIISKHANTQFTHLWLICHKKCIHCSKWLTECYASSVTRTSVFKTRYYEIHFQEIVVSANVLQSWSWCSLDHEQYLKSKIAVMPTLSSLWSLQVVIMTRVMTMLASWRLSVFSAMAYQILDLYSSIPRYYLR